MSCDFRIWGQSGHARQRRFTSGIGCIHDRMPVVLEPENVAPWLSGEAGTELLIRAAEVKLTSWPVSTRVNKAGGADGATFIIKVSWSAEKAASISL